MKKKLLVASTWSKYLTTTFHRNLFPLTSRIRKLIRVRDSDRPELTIDVMLSKDTYYPGDTVSGEITIISNTPFIVEPIFDYSVSFADDQVSQTG